MNIVFISRYPFNSIKKKRNVNIQIWGQHLAQQEAARNEGRERMDGEGMGPTREAYVIMRDVPKLKTAWSILQYKPL